MLCQGSQKINVIKEKIRIQKENQPEVTSFISHSANISASNGKRFLATLIDCSTNLILGFVFTLFLLIPNNLRTQIISEFDIPNFLDLVPYCFSFAIVSFIIAMVFNLLLTFCRGQTVGQKFLGIEVVDINSLPLTFKQALLHTLALNTTVLTFGLGNLTLFSRWHHPLHNCLAYTYVREKTWEFSESDDLLLN